MTKLENLERYIIEAYPRGKINELLDEVMEEKRQAGIDEAVERIFGEIDEFKAEVISMDYCDDFKDGIYATIEHILSMPVFESVLVPPELRQDNK